MDSLKRLKKGTDQTTEAVRSWDAPQNFRLEPTIAYIVEYKCQSQQRNYGYLTHYDIFWIWIALPLHTSLREESSQSNVHLTIKSVKNLSFADDEAE